MRKTTGENVMIYMFVTKSSRLSSFSRVMSHKSWAFSPWETEALENVRNGRYFIFHTSVDIYATLW
jgi:isopentenyldiphosphate isomerase